VAKLGFIVNPVAGLGGRVGLKGSDGWEIQRKAKALGAVPRAQERAKQALERLTRVQNLEILTYPDEMGEDVALACGFHPTGLGLITPGETTPEDTREAAREMRRDRVDLLLFAGGDGTARNVYEAVGLDLPALGVPAGVKIHSAVFATSPVHAGELAALYLEGRVTTLREAEVMDIDEEAFRHGSLSARLYGYLRVPFRTSLVQNLKRAIADELGVVKSLLGVDVVLNGQVIAADANEARLLDLLAAHQEQGGRARIVITPIGGQGYLFGRGNQQLSPRVIRQVGRENIVVVSTKEKLYGLGSQPLRVDTGDAEVDMMLSGYVQVVTGYHERAVRKVAT
jgi:predicted polyphosphate/ATP-dependent NAD kinase